MTLTNGYANLYSARDSNKFTVSVNVEAESKVTFNLTYEQLLTRKLGTYQNIINVQPGQVILQNIIVKLQQSFKKIMRLKLRNARQYRLLKIYKS